MNTDKRVHIIVLMAFLVMGGMIIPPVTAYYQVIDIQPTETNEYNQSHYYQTTDMTYSDPNLVVHGFNIHQNIDTVTTITLTYGNGSSNLEGHTSYIYILPGISERSTSLDSYSSITAISPDLTQFGDQEFAFTYASNISEETNKALSQGFLLYHIPMLGRDTETYFPITGGFESNLISSVSITSTNPIDVWLISSPADVAIRDATYTSYSADQAAQDWVTFAISMSLTVFGIVSGIFIWLKFFFIDNLLMTVSLYLAISMAYSATTSKNIFQFFRNFFKFQQKLFEFIIGLWNTLISIISSFRGIFRI